MLVYSMLAALALQCTGTRARVHAFMRARARPRGDCIWIEFPAGEASRARPTLVCTGTYRTTTACVGKI